MKAWGNAWLFGQMVTVWCWCFKRVDDALEHGDGGMILIWLKSRREIDGCDLWLILTVQFTIEILDVLDWSQML